MKHKMEKMQNTSPTSKMIGTYFHQDSKELCERFKYCWDAQEQTFDIIKSKRFKLFIDLRVALECTLKSIISFSNLSEYSGKELITKIRKYSHNIDRMIPDCKEHIPSEYQSWLNQVANELNKLPVSLRYYLDADDFLSIKNTLYYQTIGSDKWLKTLLENIININNIIEAKYFERPKLLGGKELCCLAKVPKYNSYIKKTF